MISVGDVGNPAVSFDAGSYASYSYLQIGRNNDSVLSNASLTGSDISNALFSWMQWNGTGFETSWALRKVCFWGPNPLAITGAVYRDAEIGLRVDLGDISNALEVNDGGTSTRRPAVAVSIPYSIWLDAPDTSVITIFPDATLQACHFAAGTIWGKLYLSLDWRRGPSSLPVVAARSFSAPSGSSTSTSTTTRKTGK